MARIEEQCDYFILGNFSNYIPSVDIPVNWKFGFLF